MARLLTFVELLDPANPDGMSLSARHEAELADGRRVLLLDDRGWSSTLHFYGDAEREPAPDIWSVTPRDDIEAAARMVVGPDEPFEGRSQEGMAASHWAHLAEILRREGVSAEPEDLLRLPHDVVLSERVLARL